MRCSLWAAAIPLVFVFAPVALCGPPQAPPPRPRPDPTSPAPSVGPVGPLVLRKGERVRVEQALHWNQFQQDVMSVTFAVSDEAALEERPVERSVWFDRNPVAFDYQVRAGQKAGTFTLTVTPEAGSPVSVTVVVR